mgnify:CR=1 FL=1
MPSNMAAVQNLYYEFTSHGNKVKNERSIYRTNSTTAKYLYTFE